MPKFEVLGKGKDTGRKRRKIYGASSAAEATRLAESDGTIVDEINELPPAPPTERQIDYARDLGITIPPDATKNDVSDLISIKVDNDKPSTIRHRSFAKLYGLETTEYIGKKVLFDQIKYVLDKPGRERDLASWFTYRVYRGLVKGADNAPIKGPDDAIMQKIGGMLAQDQSVIRSIRRYGGREIIWFGEFTAPSGRVYNGGSKRTIAYNAASSALKEKIGASQHDENKSVKHGNQTEGNSIPSRQRVSNNSTDADEPWDSYEVTSPAPKSSGCFTVIIAIAIILASVYFIA